MQCLSTIHSAHTAVYLQLAVSVRTTHSIWHNESSMVAALLQLHDNVEDTGRGTAHLLAQSLVVLSQYPPAPDILCTINHTM